MHGARPRGSPGRCGRTGNAARPSWSPTGKRPGSPTGHRRSARCPREWAEAHAGAAAQARAAEAELRRRDQAERAARAAGAARDQQLRQEREAEFQARLSRMVAETKALESSWKAAGAMIDIDMEA